MDGRAFIIITPIQVESELEEHPAIKKINIIIDFINNNRFRIPTEKDSEYKIENPTADLRKDVEFREGFAHYFKNSANIRKIKQQVTQTAQQKYNLSEQQAKIKAFDAMFTSFRQHSTFVHLTALELAIVGMMVDTLLILLAQVIKEVGSELARIYIANKQVELVEIRDAVINCMRYHKTIFENNLRDKLTNEFYYSDIIIHLIEKIDSATNEVFTQSIIQDITQDTQPITQHVWPDTSYLQILPPVPFYKANDLETVANYFEQYIASDPPGAEQIDKLQDDVRDKLDLLAKEESQASVNNGLAFADYLPLLFWSCLPIAGKAKNKEELVDSFERSSEEESFSFPESPRLVLDDIIRLMNNFNATAKEKLEKMEFEQTLRDQLGVLRGKLQAEISGLQKPGFFCFFSCFFIGTLRKKLHKEAALDYVLGASTLEELGQRAHEKITGHDKDMVCAGLASRTEATLRRVAEAVQVNCGRLFGTFSPS